MKQMGHATENNRGGYHPPKDAKPKGLARKAGRICRMDGTRKRRPRSTKGQTEVGAGVYAAYGFLRTTFLPRLNQTETVQACRETAKTERDFYRSLSGLARHYGIQPMQTRPFGYPYNIALALWDTQRKLKLSSKDWDSLCVVQDGKQTFVNTEERCGTGSSLYYIPVEPLLLMLNDPPRKRTGQLLLSVCAYLYHIADVPYYRQENSYLYWMYDMFSDWVEQDEQTDETEGYRKELEKAEWVGDRMEQKIFNRTNLTVFGKRLARFRCRDGFDRDCHRLAAGIFSLYTDYPNERVFRNAGRNAQSLEDDDYGNGIVSMDKYISFFADSKGWLCESLLDCTNNEFNECGEVEEPTIQKRFDGNPVTGNDLDFENRLFTAMDDLCYLLNNYKRTT